MTLPRSAAPIRSAPVLLPLLLFLAACDAPTGTEPQRAFTEREIDAYVAVALGSEFGSSARVVRRWPTDSTLHLWVRGEPSPADMSELGRVIADLNDLYGAPTLALGDSASADMRVHFAPRSEFGAISPNYVPGNDGFFWLGWDGNDVIRFGRVLIDIESIDQTTRDHLIREEITQALGLMRDSPDLGPGSVFHPDPDVMPARYGPLDSAVLRMHARPEVEPGMGETEVRQALAGVR